MAPSCGQLQGAGCPATPVMVGVATRAAAVPVDMTFTRDLSRSCRVVLKTLWNFTLFEFCTILFMYNLIGQHYNVMGL